MNILALDLGTHTGFCHTTEMGGGTISGTWELATTREITAFGKLRLNRRKDPRPQALFDRLRALELKPDLVVFEDVEFQTYTYQCQLWASFRTAAWLAFPTTKFDCVPVAALKKFATGYGSANKTLMEKYLLSRFPEYANLGLDDNAIDAIWVYKWASKTLGRMAI